VLGIEPTANTAQVAIDKGIRTRVNFWGVETARSVAAETQADLLLGNNVLAIVAAGISGASSRDEVR